MTGREQIDLLQRMKDDALYDRFGNRYEEIDNALEKAIEAMKYREPKKAVEDRMHWYRCPTCNNVIAIFDRESYLDSYTSCCEFCGQVIDWTDVWKEKGIEVSGSGIDWGED